MKKIVSLFLSIAFLFTFSLDAFAIDTPSVGNDGIRIVDNTEVSTLTAADANAYNIYNITLYPTASKSTSTVNKSTLLSFCTVENIIDSDTTVYSSTSLHDYIPFCSAITEIVVIGNILYISYTTTDAKEIIVSYDNLGMNDRGIYDVTTGTAIYYDGNSLTQYTNFRAGTSVTITDELMDKINTMIADNNLAGLKEIDELIVIEYPDGSYAIEPNVPQFSTSMSSGAQTRLTNNSALLSDLQNDFPMYTGSLILNTSGYCNALSQNISLRVRESRNSYVRQTADWVLFNVGTSLTTIGLALSVPLTAVSVILAGLSIAVSAAGTIVQAVQLCNSAIYQYTGTRVGYAYDSTTYNNFVRVITYSGTGKFTGGYTSSGYFTWVHSQISSAYNRDASTIANTALSNYNSCILSYGYCASYHPD